MCPFFLQHYSNIVSIYFDVDYCVIWFLFMHSTEINTCNRVLSLLFFIRKVVLFWFSMGVCCCSFYWDIISRKHKKPLRFISLKRVEGLSYMPPKRLTAVQVQKI
jgi:hypothetical protein